MPRRRAVRAKSDNRLYRKSLHGAPSETGRVPSSQRPEVAVGPAIRSSARAISLSDTRAPCDSSGKEPRRSSLSLVLDGFQYAVAEVEITAAAIDPLFAVTSSGARPVDLHRMPPPCPVGHHAHHHADLGIRQTTARDVADRHISHASPSRAWGDGNLVLACRRNGHMEPVAVETV